MPQSQKKHSGGGKSVSLPKGPSVVIPIPSRSVKSIKGFSSWDEDSSKASWKERLKSRCRVLCDNTKFTVLTTVLTLYALWGDDFRLAATPKSSDALFNVLTILCIIVFSVEMVVNSFGKEDYFPNFFFILDFGSTVTLLMDLTWISNSLLCGGGSEEGSAAKTGRAGRAGARAGRAVRIIRLMRLVKLYKAYKQAVEEKERTRRESVHMADPNTSEKLEPGEELEDEVISEADPMDNVNSEGVDMGEENKEENAEDKDGASETRVGKKLSEMTTRRVIVLVLVMILCLPLFQTETHGWRQFRYSSMIGADVITNYWRDFCPPGDDGELPWCLMQESATAIGTNSFGNYTAARRYWEYYFLQFIHSHQKGDSAWQVFWVGVASQKLRDRLGDEAASLYLGELAKIRTIPVKEWSTLFSNSQWTKMPPALPSAVSSFLTKPWPERCKDYLVGIPMIETNIVDCTVDEELRCSETEWVFPLMLDQKERQEFEVVFVFDKRSETTLEAGLSMLQTVFICLVVAFGAMVFSNDANQLLLNPIERMMSKMETIKDNPLEAMKLGDLEYRREQMEKAKLKEHLAKHSTCYQWLYKLKDKYKTKEPMETILLEKTIIKLGGLLALGFGEAGAEIIGQNMKAGNCTSVDVMSAGQKVDMIVGFCNIRNFMHATEVLKEKVMLFVNQVSEIVHGCVDDYHGAPNKNIGDAFLVVWRLSGYGQEWQSKLCDMSVMSFVRIIAAINKSPVLAEYRGHPGLLQRLPNFRVSLGFGLHCGWAIEGAIGSEYKIDASYLSPNVNVSARLQAATERYGVCLLMSNFMVDMCSKEMAVLCRLIDHVVVKGSKQPIRLYTLDLDVKKLEVTYRSMDKVIKNRFKVRQVREARKGEKWSDDYKVWETFRIDEDLVAMRALFSPEFFMRFSMAYRNYEAGQWLVARDVLLSCYYQPKPNIGSRIVRKPKDLPEDGPTITLLSFMKMHRYIAPDGWQGYRELTE
eukprot:gnl/TRDRNA2_/TRDRNA2_174104_c0_seq1.p1 gnl/TRDRNA2_/TRDRNA2_174104_c0~~gnl/TRDRNA2_/TRDRNA2_174104_c0_seq1.p1  ORF type:complete len:1005 (-),score=197.57 gnl/TRDRNA2_/TRDRNA2_174104_c0_seq1:247-3198(-)